MGFSKPEHKSLVFKIFNYRRQRSYQFTEFTSVAQDLKRGNSYRETDRCGQRGRLESWTSGIQVSQRCSHNTKPPPKACEWANFIASLLQSFLIKKQTENNKVRHRVYTSSSGFISF